MKQNEFKSYFNKEAARVPGTSRLLLMQLIDTRQAKTHFTSRSVIQFPTKCKTFTAKHYFIILFFIIIYDGQDKGLYL